MYCTPQSWLVRISDMSVCCTYKGADVYVQEKAGTPSESKPR